MSAQSGRCWGWAETAKSNTRRMGSRNMGRVFDSGCIDGGGEYRAFSRTDCTILQKSLSSHDVRFASGLWEYRWRKLRTPLSISTASLSPGPENYWRPVSGRSNSRQIIMLSINRESISCRHTCKCGNRLGATFQNVVWDPAPHHSETSSMRHHHVLNAPGKLCSKPIELAIHLMVDLITSSMFFGGALSFACLVSPSNKMVYRFQNANGRKTRHFHTICETAPKF